MRAICLIGMLGVLSACGGNTPQVEPAAAPTADAAPSELKLPQKTPAVGIELARAWINDVIKGRIDDAMAAMRVPFLLDGDFHDDPEKLRSELVDAYEKSKRKDFRLTGINSRPVPEKLPAHFPKILPEPYDGLEAYIATVANADQTHAMTIFVHGGKVIAIKD